MKIGDVTDPIDNGDGSQSILKLKSKTEAGFQPVSEVSKEIRDTLLAEKQQRSMSNAKQRPYFPSIAAAILWESSILNF